MWPIRLNGAFIFVCNRLAEDFDPLSFFERDVVGATMHGVDMESIENCLRY